jgi:tRNA(Ile)-lysidine synthase
LIRPLLDVSRADIEAYAAEHGLQPRHDATNVDLAYFRNHLRHTVIPLLEALNPNLRATLARTADALREDAGLVRQIESAALARVIRSARPDALIMDRAAWAGLTLGAKRAVLRAALKRLRPDLRDIGLAHVDGAIAIADRKRGTATLPGRMALRAERDVLTLGPAGSDVWELVPGEDAPALESGQGGSPFLSGEHVQRVFGQWKFEARPLVPGTDLAAIHADPLATALAVPEGAWLRLRTRQPGDRFRPRGMGGHAPLLGNVMTALKVPAAWRDRVPLLTVDHEIAWFVAPTAQGVRGRVSELFTVPDLGAPDGTALIVTRWRRNGVIEA